MKIGIVSDSHDHVRLLRAALKLLLENGAGAILHAGDIVAPFAAKLLVPPEAPEGLPVHVIYGNNDGEHEGLRKILPQIVPGPLRLTLGGRTVVMFHDRTALRPLDVAGADVVVTGHTHKALVERKDGVLYVNPGECCGELTGRATAATLDTETLDVELLEVA